MTQQEKFEAWAKQMPFFNLKRHLAGYESELINAYWAVWQAAIESVVVELPKNGQSPIFENDYAEGVVVGVNIYKASVEQALEAAGVSYK